MSWDSPDTGFDVVMTTEKHHSIWPDLTLVLAGRARIERALPTAGASPRP
ncbi:hypothetical protein [Azospirillum sp. TSH64]|nr:hypothetical protein [Azospirillum sp. TSH64]